MDALDEPREEVARLRYEIEELITTARALSSERDIRKLLSLILEKCRQVTGADAGSVYVLEGEGAPAERTLRFMLSQNDSLRIDFQEFTLGVDARSIVDKAVLDARPINIADLDGLDGPGRNPWGANHNRSFDDKTGYRARSMLTVPMLSAHSEVIGVVQLINRKRDPAQRLLEPADFATGVIPFDARSEEFALALASQAGVSLENAILYDEIRSVFEGFVDASVTAIEARDPTTSGHSRTLQRVPTIAGAHHEYLNGAGYPRGLSGGEIPIESRMMTIADIFDALTAADRPYKRAVPIDRALAIVESEVNAGKLDRALFDLFVGGEVFKAAL